MFVVIPHIPRQEEWYAGTGRLSVHAGTTSLVLTNPINLQICCMLFWQIV